MDVLNKMKTKKQLIDSFVNYRIVRKEGRLIKAGDLLFKDVWLLYPRKIKINFLPTTLYDDWQAVRRTVHSYYADGSTDVDLFFDFGTIQINGQNWYDVKEQQQ